MTFAPRKGLRSLRDWAGRRRRGARKRSGLVLMYHRIARAAADPWDLCVWPEHFESQLRVLREFADVVPLKDIHAELRAGRRTRPVVAVTFDDGYADNLYAAKPVLEEHDIKATVFLATGYLDEPSPYWWDALATAILAVDSLPTHLCLESGADRFEWRTRVRSQAGIRGRRARRALHDRLWSWLGAQSADNRPGIIEQIRAWAGTSGRCAADARPMTRAEVGELIASGIVDVGGHTRSHPMLSKLNAERKREEIDLCRRDCRDIVGRTPATFAYPHGDYDQESIDLVREIGFTLACTSQPALVWPETNPLTTPRIAVGNWDQATFRRRLRWWLA